MWQLLFYQQKKIFPHNRTRSFLVAENFQRAAHEFMSESAQLFDQNQRDPHALLPILKHLNIENHIDAYVDILEQSTKKRIESAAHLRNTIRRFLNALRAGERPRELYERLNSAFTAFARETNILLDQINA